jgi:hypothetical protein
LQQNFACYEGSTHAKCCADDSIVEGVGFHKRHFYRKNTEGPPKTIFYFKKNCILFF